MALMRIFGPWQYRRFMRWAGYFFRVMPWLWFAGIGAALAVSIFRLDERYGVTLGIVCAIAIWPVIIGWLTINGVGIVWKFALGVLHAMRRKQRPDSLGLAFAISVLFAGVVFLWGAVMIVSGLLRHALTHR
jgi:hypothetical protein